MEYTFGFAAAPAGMAPYLLYRDRIRPVLERERGALDAMYDPLIGRPEADPVLVMGICLLQIMERLTDRAAIRACLFDVRWRLALGLAGDWEGLDASTLCNFRKRLCEHGQGSLALDAGLAAMREAGYLKKQGAVRIDSTHMLGLVAAMSRLECVRETLRLSLEFLRAFGGAAAWEPWLTRYADQEPEERRRRSAEQTRANMTQAGLDTQAVLAKADALGDAVRAAEPVQLLRRVYAEQFVVSDTVAARPVSAAGAVQNPHDPEAQWSTKNALGKAGWVGYKLQVCETVAEGTCARGEPTPAVITAVVTQPATASDFASLDGVLEQHVQLGQQKPQTVHVDAGYISAAKLAEAEQDGLDICGPIPAPPHGPDRFGSDDFDVDLDRRQAICPAGLTSARCSFIREAYSSRSFYYFEWARSACETCAIRQQCISARTKQTFRSLQVNEHYMHAQHRRRLCRTPDYRKRMQRRNGIEATISELKRAYGIRRARYRGLDKNGLLSCLAAAACNLRRWSARIHWLNRERA